MTRESLYLVMFDQIDAEQPIVRTGCGFVTTREDLGRLRDLDQMEKLLAAEPPFVAADVASISKRRMRKTPQTFITFSGALRYAVRGGDGIHVAITNCADKSVCIVRLD